MVAAPKLTLPEFFVNSSGNALILEQVHVGAVTIDVTAVEVAVQFLEYQWPWK